MNNKEFLIFLRQHILKRERKELKKKLKENYYDRRLDRDGKSGN